MNSTIIRYALDQAGIHHDVVSTRDLSGGCIRGCIHRVVKIDLADGCQLVAKINTSRMSAVFEEEAASLRTLAATKTVIVPEPLGVTTGEDQAVLLMTAITPGTAHDETWRGFGRELAAMHATDIKASGKIRGGYGFEMDNHIGSTPQPNTWCDDWVEFNATYRLGFQVRLARDGGKLSAGESRHLEAIIRRLDRLIPRHPRPALLHGDLWSGNALPTVDDQGETRIAVIDPAAYVGDGWADIAMMKLFGGFSLSCFASYTDASDDREQLESRIDVYQLYHVLNHLNLFGQGYLRQVMALVARLQ